MAAENDHDANLDALLRAAEREEADTEEEERIDFRDVEVLLDLAALNADIPLHHPGLPFVVKSEWRYIRSYTRRITPIMSQYNLRWASPTGPRLRQYLQHIYDASRRPMFVLAMAGFYLAYSATEAGLFYAEENTQIFADPSKLRSQADLDRYAAEWPSSARIIRDFKRYFDTQVKVLGIANVLFFVVTPANRTMLP